MRVAVTGIGMVNALGNSSKEVWRGLLEGVSGISRFTEDLPVQIGGKPNFNREAWRNKLKVT